MKSEDIKKAVLEVLNEGGMAQEECNPLNLNLDGNNLWTIVKRERIDENTWKEWHEKLEPTINEIVPNDIETRMLDWLQNKCDHITHKSIGGIRFVFEWGYLPKEFGGGEIRIICGDVEYFEVSKTNPALSQSQKLALGFINNYRTLNDLIR